MNRAETEERLRQSLKREEALWVEIVRLRNRVAELERENKLLHERHELMRQLERTGLPPTVQAPAVVTPVAGTVLDRRGPGDRLSPDEREEVVRLLRSGVSRREIARRVNCSVMTVHRIAGNHRTFTPSVLGEKYG